VHQSVKARPVPLLTYLAAPTAAAVARMVMGLGVAGNRCCWQPVYTWAGIAVAFIISELPGGRAEVLLNCNGSDGAHGGRAIRKRIRALLHVSLDQRVRNVG
jgi:hypothetical protein